MLTDGSDVWVTYRDPVEVEGDNRPHARYFIQRLDLADLRLPVEDPPINVPGELLVLDARGPREAGGQNVPGPEPRSGRRGPSAELRTGG